MRVPLIKLDAADGAIPSGNLRFDFAPIRGVERTPQGFLRIDSNLGRVGVLKYVGPDGKVRHELRPPDEVFRADSLATLRGAIVTDKHPPRSDAWITPKNWKKWAVGFVGDDVRQDGERLVRGSITATDSAMIAMIDSGDRREISPGYVCLDMDETPGRWNGKEYGPHVTSGERYDAVQRTIVYNSIGIGPRGWGRQGSDVSLRLDGGIASDAMLRLDGTQLGDFIRTKMLELGMSMQQLAEATGIIAPKWREDDPMLRSGPAQDRTWILGNIVDGWTDRPSNEQLRAIAKALDTDLETLIRLLPEELRNLDGRNRRSKETRRMDLITIKLDGVDIEVTKPAAQLVEKFIATQTAKVEGLQGQVTKLTADQSALQAKLDAATEKATKLEAELKDAPAKARTAAIARVALETQAHRVLGKDKDGKHVNLDGKTDREVQVLVLAKVAPKATVEGKDDAYVSARFDAAMEDFKDSDASAKGRGTNVPLRGLPVTKDKLRQDAGEQREDGGEVDPYDAEAARKRMIARNNTASQGKQGN